MRWKWIITAVGGIIILLIVTTYVVLISYDFNKIKPQISNFVKDATGRELTLGGDLVLDIDFTPSLSIENVTFENASWGSRPELAKIKQLKVEVALLPLIRGDIDVKQLILTEPEILVETDPSGKSNLAFKHTDTQKEDTIIPLFAFNQVRIEKGRLKYRDGKTSRVYSTDLDLFRASASGFKSKIELDANGRFIEKRFEIKGEVGSTEALILPSKTCPINLAMKLGSASFMIDGSIKDTVHFKDLTGTLTAKGPSISELLAIVGVGAPSDLGPFHFTAKLSDTNGTYKLETMRFQAGTDAVAEVTLSGAIENLNTLQGARLDFEINGKDIASLEKFYRQPMPVRGAFSVSGKLSNLSISRYEIDNLKVRFGENTIEGAVDLDLIDPRPVLTLTLSSQNLDLRSHWASGVPEVMGKGNLSDIGPFQLAMKLVGPAEQLMLENVDMRFGSLQRIETRLNGKINDLNALKEIAFDFLIQGNDVAHLEKFTGHPLPFKGTFAVSGKAFDTAANDYKVDGLKVVLGETILGGSMDLDFTDAQPRIAALLSSNKIVLKNPWTQTASGQSPKNDRLDLGPLNLSVRLEGLTEKVALKTFDLKFGSEQLAEFMISGSIRNLKAPQGVDLKFNVHGKDLGNLKQVIGRPLPIQGPFTMSGQIVDSSINQFTIKNLKLAAAGNHMNGEVALDLNKPQPQLKATLGIPKFFPHRIIAPHVSAVNTKKEFPDLGPLNLKMTLTGPVSNISLEGINFNMGNEKRIEAKLSGTIKQLAKRQGVLLDFSVRGKDAQTLGQLIGRPFPVQGVFSISGKVTDTDEKSFRVDNLKLILSENELQGWMDINPIDGQLRLAADLSAQRFNLRPLSNTNIQNIGRLKRVQDFGPIKLTAKAVNRAGKLSIEQLDFHAGTEKLVQLQVQGVIKDLTAPRGMSFDFSIRGNEVAKVTDLIGKDFPIRGKFGVSGQVADRTEQIYKLKDLRITLGDNHLSGQLDVDLTGRKPRLAAELASQELNLKPLTINTLAPLADFPNLGPLKIAIIIAGLNDAISVDKLDLKLGSEDLAAITLTGSIKKVSALEGLNFGFSVKGSDLTNIQKLGGPIIPYKGAFHVSGKMIDSAPKIYQLSNLNLIVGEYDAKGSVSLDLTQKRPQLTAELTSQKADLRPLLVKTKISDDQKKATVNKKSKVFS